MKIKIKVMTWAKSITYSINSIISIETDVDLGKKSFDELAKLNTALKSNGETEAFTGNSCENGTNNGKNCTLQENGIYEAEDNDGTSYYFRGTVENNYVKFGKLGKTDDGADIWWRIIRINGDGSIRMIYAGTSDDDTVPNQTDGTSVITVGNQTTFNYSPGGDYNNNMYVGFEYADNIRNGSTKYYETDTVHNTEGHKSNALEQLNTWFEENLSDEFKEGINTLIDTNAGFCADRSAYSSTSVDSRNDNDYGVGTRLTYYGGYIRTIITHEPTYKCEDEKNDLFTYENSNKGTQSLTYPIGLTTIDEQVYAGNHWSGSNKGYYLYNGATYWTMSPYYFDRDYAYVFFVYGGGGVIPGSVSAGNVRSSIGIRPVLNLVSGALKSGSGAADDPFKTIAESH